jgi:hypothetical protein
MNLDEGQKRKVGVWISQGLKLSEIQSRLASEFGLNLTYMDVRLLVDDLKLTPKDAEPAQTSSVLSEAAVPSSKAAPPPPESQAEAPGSGQVSVAVDQLARPGALVSGKVTFSDGKQADWYMDQTGRLGLVPQQPGYRPPPADLQKFQASLEAELARIGF